MKKYMRMSLMMGALAVSAIAEEGHRDAHDHGIVAGPKGGKMIASQPQQAEFWVNADRRVEVTFYDDHGTAITPGDQAVSVTAQAPGGNAVLVMEKGETAFVSSEPLPAGDGCQIVVQIKPAPGGSFQNFRITYDPGICGECNRAEYACTCGH
jgi:hypothetical protein